ncbi:MAG: replication/maintenance protein RepL [Selenomonadaceae bacterium]|nr:replication/maintenance protein RepL [Selenomonadaceae bacterium]
MSEPKTKVMHVHKLIDSDTGEILSSSRYFCSENGKDWWIMYRITMAFIASGQLTYSAVRVYMHIAARADWRGVLATTRTAIAKEIKLSVTAVSEGINELKRYDLIRETKERGLPVLVVNPEYATLGKNKKERMRIFNSLPSIENYVRLDSKDKIVSSF